ncbi:fructose PTS transporter subunit IIA [Spiroplasma sp. DGKH1]|uniref:fructose PTS transporter subunit IIA n=1 Tax=Spiroplasma sp. DGKH1 TaxID=3050074 RepID=UPI0034C6AA31
MEIDHKLFNESHIVLESKAKSQQEAFQELAELAFKLGYVTSVEALVAGFTKRESESSTGFEDGFAIPHALIPEVTKPAILFLRMANGVDWKSMDGKPTKIAIAIIIPGDKATELHLDVLSSISVKLVDKGFRDNLKHAKTPQEVLTLMGSDVKQSKKVVPTGKTIVGVSACTTGVVHTYMCKELLEQAGAKMGYNIHIECQGQKGLEYEIPKKMLDEAEVVILANDVGIDMDRFIGKKVYPCGTAPVVKDAEKVIKDALAKGYIYGESNDNSDFIANSGRGKPAILKHLLSGVSYMIPFVVFAGLCFAIMSGIAKGTYGDGFGFGSSWNIGQTAADGHVITLADWGATKNFNLLQMAHVLMIINNIANIGFGLMIPIMGGYIAFSIAGRPAIAPAMIVTYMLVNPGSGLWWDFNGALNLNGGVIDAHQPF